MSRDHLSLMYTFIQSSIIPCARRDIFGCQIEGREIPEGGEVSGSIPGSSILVSYLRVVDVLTTGGRSGTLGWSILRLRGRGRCGLGLSTCTPRDFSKVPLAYVVSRSTRWCLVLSAFVSNHIFYYIVCPLIVILYELHFGSSITSL